MHRFPNEVAKSFHLIHKDFDNMYIYKSFCVLQKVQIFKQITQYWLIHKCFSERTTHVETEYFPGKKNG